ncbi:MAG: response regulator [Candidatus Omnitrophica bacterium]|nr:response regulator [Candidatus Omnitrophota bacterium]
MSEQPVRVLLVEDTAEDTRLIREVLTHEPHLPLRLLHAERLSTALELLAKESLDLVLLDLRLPDSEGLATLTAIRQRAPRVPVVVLTASDDDALATQALQHGAQDYLVKGYIQVYPTLLTRSMRYAMERQRGEDEVRAAHGLTAQLVAAIPSILIGLGPDGLVTHWNAVAQDTFGLPAAQALGRPLAEVSVRWEAAEIQGCISRCRASGRSARIDELPFASANGRTGMLGLTVSPMRSETGEPMGFLIFGADITERKHSELERQRLQEQLRQTQQMETIGRFAGGIAHDFNNFLQVILGFAFFIRSRHRDDPALINDLDEIAHAAESASRMVQQLLAFGRRQRLQPKVIDVNQTVQQMSRLLQQLVGEPISLRLELEPHALYASLDLTGFEQILMNLASNARDAMPAGGSLTIRTAAARVGPDEAARQPSAKAGEYVRLSVQDAGLGMEAQVAARIFEPFFTTKKPGKGTGLGLAVVYGVVQQHGGFITIDTAPGRGTAFHLFFPRQLEATAAPERPAPAAAPPARDGQGKRRVLIVDDDASIRLLCARILQEAYEVQVVPSADRALDILKRVPYDLLLTDLRMPEMDGFALIEEAVKAQPALNILAMTGSITPDVEQRMLAVPRCAAVLHKPFSAQALQQAVGKAVSS